jgi:hypothetical protein
VIKGDFEAEAAAEDRLEISLRPCGKPCALPFQKGRVSEEKPVFDAVKP